VLHDPSDTLLIWWFAAVANGCAAYYFCGDRDTLIQDYLMSRKYNTKEQYLFDRNCL